MKLNKKVRNLFTYHLVDIKHDTVIFTFTYHLVDIKQRPIFQPFTYHLVNIKLYKIIKTIHNTNNLHIT